MGGHAPSDEGTVFVRSFLKEEILRYERTRILIRKSKVLYGRIQRRIHRKVLDLGGNRMLRECDLLCKAFEGKLVMTALQRLKADFFQTGIVIFYHGIGI